MLVICKTTGCWSLISHTSYRNAIQLLGYLILQHIYKKRFNFNSHVRHNCDIFLSTEHRIFSNLMTSMFSGAKVTLKRELNGWL